MGMSSKRQRMRISARKALELLDGKAIGVRVPSGVEVLELEIEQPDLLRRVLRSPMDITKLVDVFFNGRKA